MFGKKIVGLEPLCSYYQSLGIDAAILPEDSPENIVEHGVFKHDNGYIKVKGRNFDLVTMRMSIRGIGGSGVSMGGVPLASKTKIPFEYHHIVRRDPSANEGSFKAKLEKKTKGLISKEIVDVAWEGGHLATTLDANAEMKKTIMNFVTREDGLKVEPDRDNRCVRVIFTRPSKIEAGLLEGFRFDRSLLPEGAVEVIDNIAETLRQIPA
ncbi:MAG: hypothetical protein HY296_03155 [Thaumarchaeota archaeon]|nr:hypothetical protein [Nitrososphaerota archaeon]